MSMYVCGGAGFKEGNPQSLNSEMRREGREGGNKTEWRKVAHMREKP